MRWLSPRTPTVDTDLVFTVTASGDLTATSTGTGKTVWSKSYPVDFKSPKRPWGFCDYPLVDGENLICVPGGPKAAVVALNKQTGEVAWSMATAVEESIHHAAPVASTSGGVRHYIVNFSEGLTGIALGGQMLWRYTKTRAGTANSYTPVVRDDIVFAANGYGGGVALLNLVPEAGGLRAVEVYRQGFPLNPLQDNTVLVGRHIYTVRSAATPVCVDLQTGQTVWERVGVRRCAMIYADGHLYLRRSDGSTTLIEASPLGYVEKGSFNLPNPEEVFGVTPPVVAGGRLYLRDNDRLFCYDVRAQAISNSSAPQKLRILKPSSQLEASGSISRDLAFVRRPDAIFVTTPWDVVTNMLKAARLSEHSLLYDLGSGDGRFLIAAASSFRCKAIGVEIDSALVAESRAAVTRQGLENLVKIEEEDFFKVNLSRADAVMLYLPPELLQRLRPQLAQVKPGARIVSHQFLIPGVPPDLSQEMISEDGDMHRIYVWTAPLPPLLE